MVSCGVLSQVVRQLYWRQLVQASARWNVPRPWPLVNQSSGSRKIGSRPLAAAVSQGQSSLEWQSAQVKKYKKLPHRHLLHHLRWFVTTARQTVQSLSDHHVSRICINKMSQPVTFVKPNKWPSHNMSILRRTSLILILIVIKLSFENKT